LKASRRSQRFVELSRRLALGAVAASCSYDFDQFVREPTGGAPSAAGSASTETGGSSGLGSIVGSGAGSTKAGTGGSSATTSATDGGEAGAAGPAPNGGSGGHVGTGGTQARGGSGGGGAAGKPSSAGEAGKASSAASGGKTSSAGASGGKTSSAGASGGKTSSAGASGASSSTCSGTTFGGHCYFLIGTDSGLDWPTAKTTCEAHSKTTHLVTITSADEQTALVKAFFPSNTDTWIGLSQKDPSKSPDALCKVMADQCPFVWVTGEALGYTDWSTRSSSDREPNYSGSCVRMRSDDQSWGDTSCTGSKDRAICEEE
jgi:hypothetical protein